MLLFAEPSNSNHGVAAAAEMKFCEPLSILKMIFFGIKVFSFAFHYSFTELVYEIEEGRVACGKMY